MESCLTVVDSTEAVCVCVCVSYSKTLLATKS